MDIIKRGAEAILYLDEYEGAQILVKERIKKGYRIPELDMRIRSIRTRSEARLIEAARRCGVPAPIVFHVNDFKIIMEYIKGKRLKEFFDRCNENDMKEIAYKIGRLCNRLHTNEIIHGDLTTSNMILRDNDIVFIDFGLGFFSRCAEDMATDLSVLKEAITSTHFMFLNIIWENIIEGYKQENPRAEEVLKTLAQIEKRGRYVKRE